MPKQQLPRFGAMIKAARLGFYQVGTRFVGMEVVCDDEDMEKFKVLLILHDLEYFMKDGRQIRSGGRMFRWHTNPELKTMVEGLVREHSNSFLISVNGLGEVLSTTDRLTKGAAPAS